MKDSILAIFAHPDDEAFGTGGALACYASSGVDVYLVCATRGEVGEISDPSYATPETLGEVREDELRCAAETMGVKELIFLDYRDSGMVGTDENDDPRAFINATPKEVVPQLVSIIRRLQPKVVVTFEPYGGYGHPDHIAIHKHTVAAFHDAANENKYPNAGNPWHAQRLFYTVIPRSFFLEMRSQVEELGENNDDFEFLNNPEIGWPAEKVNLKLDVSGSVEQKWEALNCHRTQFGPENLFRRLPEARVKEIMSQEYFALAWPEPAPGTHLTSLFESLE